MSLDPPVVMGVINVTPDSFFAGSRSSKPADVDISIREMARQGAGIIDIGAMSSRPGAQLISASEEIGRLRPVLEDIGSRFPEMIFSIDTLHANTARYALEQGVHVVNDISGGKHDPEILYVAGEYNAPYVLMHLRGTPEDMMENTTYDDLMVDIADYFIHGIRMAREAGITDIILDPGIGFGKSVTDNFRILRELRDLNFLGKPLLLGISRKSLINKTLGISSSDALNGTTVLNTLGLSTGADILRVHDVKQAVECVRLFEAFQGREKEEGEPQ